MSLLKERNSSISKAKSSLHPDQIRVLSSLRRSQCAKLALPAGLDDLAQIEETSRLAATSGFSLVQAPPSIDAVRAIKRGFQSAKLFGDESPLISVGVSLDRYGQSRRDNFFTEFFGKDNAPETIKEPEAPRSRASKNQAAQLAQAQPPIIEQPAPTASIIVEEVKALRPLCHNEKLFADDIAKFQSSHLSHFWFEGVRGIDIATGENFGWLESYLASLFEYSAHAWLVSVSLPVNILSSRDLLAQAAAIKDVFAEDAIIELVSEGEKTALSLLSAMQNLQAAPNCPHYLIKGDIDAHFQQLMTQFSLKSNGLTFSPNEEELSQLLALSEEQALKILADFCPHNTSHAHA